MRIALLSLDFPPDSYEGIPRQRETLAKALADQGADVHVITLGRHTKSSERDRYRLHVVAPPPDTVFTPSSPGLNRRLTQSQLLFEVVRSLESQRAPFHVIDTPLWGLQSYVTACYAASPVVLWLQTTQAQLYHIHNQEPRPWERQELELERLCLARSMAWLADSDSILLEVEAAYQLVRPASARTVHLGLFDTPLTKRAPKGSVQILVVGRLEKRKGTPLLFQALPSILRSHPDVRVKFVGGDNSQADGWHQENGLTYADAWVRWNPDLADRICFTGPVSDDVLLQEYSDADIVVAPSLYESFGLVYLEAMRARLPVIAIASGAVKEVFPNEERDGAVIISHPDPVLLAHAMEDLILDPARRQQVGRAGRQNFERRFSAQRMAAETLSFYEQVIAGGGGARRRAVQPVRQVMEALDIGDAVSTITRTNARVLDGLGQPPRVVAMYHHPSLQGEVDDPNVLFRHPDCHIVFHYWGYSHLAWQLKYHRGQKALYYHNITPWRFFDPVSPAYQSTLAGYKQLALIANDFDFLMGDSVFNIKELAPYLREAKPALCVYPTVDVDHLRQQPVDTTLKHFLTAERSVNFLMVGRIARNKRQDRVMRLFDVYWRNINRHSHLWLVGSEASDPDYRQELTDLLPTLASHKHIHFTGKIPDDAVAAHYQSASVFVCASEHEGFCMPLIEAMAHGIPVVAWNAAAVPETMGNAGILVDTWDEVRIAELINVILKDHELRQYVIHQQSANLERFTLTATRKRLKTAVDYLNGLAVEDPSIFYLSPTSVSPDQRVATNA